MTVETVFVGHIPIREDYDARRESLSLPSFLGVSDFEKDIVPVLELLIEPALKSIGPFRVVLDDRFEVVEELAVGINARNFDVRASMLNKIALEEWDRLQLLKASHELVERGIQFNDLLE